MTTTFNVSFPGIGINNLKINDIAFTIGTFSVYWYGIIIASGFLLAVAYCFPRVKKYGLKLDSFIDCVIIGLVCGVIGARLYYVIFKWDYYSQHISEIFKIHNGGLAIYGGIMGALIGGLTVAKIKKMNIPAILDLSVIGFLIGQGIGRWGNFVNQEAFGSKTNTLFRMVSENINLYASKQGTSGVEVHPCFLYESIWCLLGVLVLHIFTVKFKKYYGQVFFLYLIWYGFERMIVEELRTDSLYIPNTNIRISQLLAFLTMLIGIAMLVYFHIKKANKTITLIPIQNDTVVSNINQQILNNEDISNDDNKE